jgi:hypothetical protein
MAFDYGYKDAEINWQGKNQLTIGKGCRFSNFPIVSELPKCLLPIAYCLLFIIAGWLTSEFPV